MTGVAEGGEFKIDVGASSVVDGSEKVERALSFDAAGDPSVRLYTKDAQGAETALQKLPSGEWSVPEGATTIYGKVDDEHWSGDLSPTLSETVTDGTETGEPVTRTETVTITPVVDATAEVTNTDAITVNEDDGFTLPVSAGSVDPSEALTVEVSGLPEGTQVSYTDNAGKLVSSTAGSNGEASLELPQGVSLSSLSVQLPEHYSGTVSPKVDVTATDTPEGGGTPVQKIVGSHTFNVTIAPVADGGVTRLFSTSFSGGELLESPGRVTGGQDASGLEGDWISWSQTFQFKNGNGQGEEISLYSNDHNFGTSEWRCVDSEGQPLLDDDGEEIEVFVQDGPFMADGNTYAYKIAIPQEAIVLNREDNSSIHNSGDIVVNGLQVKPVVDKSKEEDFEVLIEVVTGLDGQESRSYTIQKLTVNPKIDGFEDIVYLPSKIVEEDSGGVVVVDGQNMRSIQVGDMLFTLGDTDGSEHVEYLSSHYLPEGAYIQFPDGAILGNGERWTLADGWLDRSSDGSSVTLRGIKLLVPEHTNTNPGSPLEIWIAAEFRDEREDKSADGTITGAGPNGGWVGSFKVEITPVADSPIITVNPDPGKEDEYSRVEITVEPQNPSEKIKLQDDSDGTETAIWLKASTDSESEKEVYLKYTDKGQKSEFKFDGERWFEVGKDDLPSQKDGYLKVPPSALVEEPAGSGKFRFLGEVKGGEDYAGKVFLEAKAWSYEQHRPSSIAEGVQSSEVDIRDVVDGINTSSSSLLSRETGTGHGQSSAPGYYYAPVRQYESQGDDGRFGLPDQLIRPSDPSEKNIVAYDRAVLEEIGAKLPKNAQVVGDKVLIPYDKDAQELPFVQPKHLSGEYNIPVEVISVEDSGSVKYTKFIWKLTLSPEVGIPQSDEEKKEFLPDPKDVDEGEHIIVPTKVTPQDIDGSEKVLDMRLVEEVAGYDVHLPASLQDVPPSPGAKLSWNQEKGRYVCENGDEIDGGLSDKGPLVLVPRLEAKHKADESVELKFEINVQDSDAVDHTFTVTRSAYVRPVADTPEMTVDSSLSEGREGLAPLPSISVISGEKEVGLALDGSEKVFLVLSGMSPEAALLKVGQNGRWELAGRSGDNGEWIIDAETLESLREPDGSIPKDKLYLSDSSKTVTSIGVRAVAVEEKGTGSDQVARSDQDTISIEWKEESTRPEDPAASGGTGSSPAAGEVSGSGSSPSPSAGLQSGSSAGSSAASNQAPLPLGPLMPTIEGNIGGSYAEGSAISLANIRAGTTRPISSEDPPSNLSVLIKVPKGFRPFEATDGDSPLAEGVAWYKEETIQGDTWQGVPIADLPGFMKTGGDLAVRWYSVPADKANQFEIRAESDDKLAQHYAGGPLPISLAALLTQQGRSPLAEEKDFKPLFTVDPDGLEFSADVGKDGVEGGGRIPLNLSMTLVDGDETITYLALEGDGVFPAELRFVDRNGNEFTLNEANSFMDTIIKGAAPNALEGELKRFLEGLSLKPGPDFSGEVSFTLRGETTDMGVPVEKFLSVTVPIKYQVDAPTLDEIGLGQATVDTDGNLVRGGRGNPIITDVAAGSVTVKEDGLIVVEIGARLTDTDGSEVLTAEIEGMAPGSALLYEDEQGHLVSAGTLLSNGKWLIDNDAFSNLNPGEKARFYIRSPEHHSGEHAIKVTVYAREVEGMSTVSTEKSFTAVINAVADDATVTVGENSAVSGTEDEPIDFNLSVQLSDADGSESVTKIVFKGVPSDWTPSVEDASAGTFSKDNTSGEWTWTPSSTWTPTLDDEGHITNLPKFSFETPLNFSGSASLTAVVHTQDTDGSQEELVMEHEQSFTVNITGVADNIVADNVSCEYVADFVAPDGTRYEHLVKLKGAVTSEDSNEYMHHYTFKLPSGVSLMQQVPAGENLQPVGNAGEEVTFSAYDLSGYYLQAEGGQPYRGKVSWEVRSSNQGDLPTVFQGELGVGTPPADSTGGASGGRSKRSVPDYPESAPGNAHLYTEKDDTRSGTSGSVLPEEMMEDILGLNDPVGAGVNDNDASSSLSDVAGHYEDTSSSVEDGMAAALANSMVI